LTLASSLPFSLNENLSDFFSQFSDSNFDDFDECKTLEKKIEEEEIAADEKMMRK